MANDTQTEISGVLNINKPGGMTSHDVVNRIRKLYNTRRVGHTGTLDPMATGVLVVLVGRAAKAAEYISSSDKRYTAGLRLGTVTDTGDITGKIISQTDILPGPGEVAETVLRFTGDILQIPPMYSAIKIKGRKLVDLARRGIEVEREPRTVTIHSLTCKRQSADEYILDVHCSAGTYIRTLCEDIGKALGCGGTMSSLERRASGRFSIEKAMTPDEIEAMTTEERAGVLTSVDELFADCPALHLKGFFAKLANSGAGIYQSKIKTNYNDGEKIRMYDENGFFALGEVQNLKEGSAVKPLKLFRI